MKFAERLKTLRTEKKLSITKLSEKVGMSAKTIGRWEKEHQAPKINKVIVLAKFFEVSVNYLLGLE